VWLGKEGVVKDMATVVCTEMLKQPQLVTWLNPESQIYKLDAGNESLRKKKWSSNEVQITFFFIYLLQMYNLLHF
jgi:hypothetical protein